MNTRPLGSILLGFLLLAPYGAKGADPTCSPRRSDLSSLYSSFYKNVVSRITCPKCQEVRTSCDLLKLDPIPEIVFLGEYHNNSSRSLIGDLAARGLFPLDAEVGPGGGMLPWESYSSHVKGIESPIPYAVVQSYFIQRQSIDNSLRNNLKNGSAELIATQVAPNVATNPLFKKAYEDIRKIKNVCDDCFAAVDEIATIYLKEGKAANINKMLTRFQSTFSPEMSSFLDLLHAQIIEIAKEKYSDRLPAQDLMTLTSRGESEQFGLYEGGSFRPGSPFAKLVEQVRDRDFAGMIADSLCQLSANSSHLVVLVGNDHVDRISELLKGLSAGRVKVRHFETGKSSDLETFLTLVPKIKYKGERN